MNTYLFSYYHNRERYSFEITAASRMEARERLYSLQESATYDGVLEATIPAPLGFVAKAWVWLRNFWKDT